MMRGFAPGEYTARLARIQAGMARHALGALLLSTEPEIRYFTGFLTRFWESPSRPWFLVIPATGDPIAVIPSIGAALMSRTWIADIRTWRSPDPVDDGVSLLSETLREIGGVVGVPSGPESHLRMPLTDFERVKALSGLTFRDDGGLLARSRAVKSEAEITKIRVACDIAGRAFGRVPDIAAEGVPLSQVFRDFQRILLEEGADWVPYLAGGAGPSGYEDVISPASDRELRAGDVLMLDTGAVWDGYFCDFDRNYSIGPPDPSVAAAHRTLIEATAEACDAARAGIRACDLWQVLATRTGADDGAGRLGHGLGMQLTEGLSLTSQDQTVLEPGMVITLEPSVTTSDGCLMVHEENIVIRDGPADRLSPFAPAELQQI